MVDHVRIGRWRRRRNMQRWHPWIAVHYWRVWREGFISARPLLGMWWKNPAH